MRTFLHGIYVIYSESYWNTECAVDYHYILFNATIFFLMLLEL